MKRAAILVSLALLAAGCRVRTEQGGGGEGAPDIDADSPAGQGYLAVQARNCARCHQASSPSAGVLSGQDTPVPQTRAYGSNLTPDPDTGMDYQDAGTLAASVLHATTPDGGPLCSAMPAYADAGMDAAEALAIGAYLQSLVPVRHAVPASVCGR